MNVRDFATALIALSLALPACASAQRPMPRALVTTSEVRSYFRVVGDTMPEATSRVASLARSLAIGAPHSPPSLDTTCAIAFDARNSWLIYVDRVCHDHNIPGRTVEDGDALVQVSRNGRRVLRTLLNPGGIEVLAH